MCRMLGAVDPGGVDAGLLASFRSLATAGRRLRGQAGHHDGWGIVRAEPHLTYAGRSPSDAASDPGYPEAVASLSRSPARLVLAHLRAASRGDVSLENTHPFLEAGFAFCHNGTIRFEGPGSDSRRYFALVLRHVRDGLPPDEALLAAVGDIEAQRIPYSSLTCLLTDGRTLWGYRGVGEAEGCTADACAAYYTLAWAKAGPATLLAQETAFLDGPLRRSLDWAAVPDRSLVAVDASGSVRLRT